MHTTEPSSPPACRPPTLRDQAAEVAPVVGAIFVAGPPVVVAWTAIVLFALMLAGPFALAATFVLVLVAAASVVALAGAILATPYLLVRHLRLPVAERRHLSGAWAPIATVIAWTGRARKRVDIPALVQPTTPRVSR
jgi:hypothetical protein